MNENLNLCKILKGCPEGITLYSIVHGEVSIISVDDDETDFPITVMLSDNTDELFTAGGKLFTDYSDGECLLFPSRDQRDWSKFTAPWYKKEKFDPKTLKAFDKVLVRDSDDDSWCCDLFSHIKEENIDYKYVASSFFCYRCCIPYNDETKHLVGTSDEAPGFYRYWED